MQTNRSRIMGTTIMAILLGTLFLRLDDYQVPKTFLLLFISRPDLCNSFDDQILFSLMQAQSWVCCLQSWHGGPLDL